MPEGQHLAKCSGDTKRTSATNIFGKLRPVAAFIYISGNSDATTRQFTRHVTTTHHPSPNTLHSHPPPLPLASCPRGALPSASRRRGVGRRRCLLSGPPPSPSRRRPLLRHRHRCLHRGRMEGGSDVGKNNIGFQSHRRICLHSWQSANFSPLIVYMVVLYFALPVAPQG